MTLPARVTQCQGLPLPAQVTQHQSLPFSPMYSEAGFHPGQERGTCLVSHQGHRGEWARLTIKIYSFPWKDPECSNWGAARSRALGDMQCEPKYQAWFRGVADLGGLQGRPADCPAVRSEKREKLRDLAGPSSVLTSKAFYNLSPCLSPNSYLDSYVEEPCQLVWLIY